MATDTVKTVQNPFCMQNVLSYSVLGVQCNSCFVFSNLSISLLMMILSSSRMPAMVKSPFLLQKKKMRKISR